MAPVNAFGLATLVALYTSSTVYLYYTAALLIVVAMIYRDPDRLVVDNVPKLSVLWKNDRTSVVTVAIVSFVVAPVVIPVPARWFGSSPVTVVSLWQALVGPALLLWFCWLIWSALRALRSDMSRLGVRELEH